MDGLHLPRIAAMIDLDRYPIAPLAGERAGALAEDCRAQLAATGSCLLPGFLTAEAVATMAAEAAEVAPLAHRKAGGRGTHRAGLRDRHKGPQQGAIEISHY